MSIVCKTRHQDTERTPRMFGTLIVELPCSYTGAELSVFDPEDAAGREVDAGADTERPTHKFCWQGESETGMRFTAFYADCFHCVSKGTTPRLQPHFCL